MEACRKARGPKANGDAELIDLLVDDDLFFDDEVTGLSLLSQFGLSK